MVKIPCNFVHETGKAILVEIIRPGKKKEEREWFPHSQVRYCQKGLDEWLEMSEWLANERGLL